MMVRHAERFVSPLTIVADEHRRVRQTSGRDDGGVREFEIGLAADDRRLDCVCPIEIDDCESRKCKEFGVDSADAGQIVVDRGARHDLGEGDC